MVIKASIFPEWSESARLCEAGADLQTLNPSQSGTHTYHRRWTTQISIPLWLCALCKSKVKADVLASAVFRVPRVVTMRLLAG